MKVLLIYPPLDHMLKTQHPDALEKVAVGQLPPLGLLYVAGYLQTHSPHQVEVLDAIMYRTSYQQIEERIRKSSPQVVGIYSTVFTWIDVLKTTELVKRIDRNIHVCLGGPLVSTYPEDIMERDSIDSAIIEEGEISFTELVNHLAENKPLEKVRGILYRKNGNIIRTEPREVVGDLDTLPFPARHLISYRNYYDLIGRRRPMTTISTSRGCPNKCAFCNRIGLQGYRTRSPENIVKEIEHCVSMGIGEFFIIDDNFTLDRQRVMDFCDLLIKKRLPIDWDIRTRVDAVDEEMVERLKAAGCKMIRFGVESGTDDILKVLNKKLTVRRIEETFDILKRKGMRYIPYFIIGCPTETREQIMKTIELAIKLDPPYVVFAVLLILPKTTLFFEGLEKGLFKNDFWLDFIKNPREDFKPKFWVENFTEKELDELLAYAHKRFYVRPGYILQRLLEVRSWSEFLTKANVGLKIIFQL